MKKYKLLYDIKSLDLLIVRALIGDVLASSNEFKNFPTPTQMRIIEYIMESKENVYQKDLEDVLNLRRATVSGVLQTMEKNNLIKRVSSDNDARTKMIILNKEAKDMFLKHEKKMKEIEKVVINGISEKDLEKFSNILKSMKNNINNYTLNCDLGKGGK